MRWYQFTLGELLVGVTLFAILCSALSMLAPFFPAEIWRLALIALVMAAVPGALIGRRIDRTFESLYLAVIWGFWAAILTYAPRLIYYLVLDPLAAMNSTPATSTVIIAALIGGACGGLIMCAIKKWQ